MQIKNAIHKMMEQLFDNIKTSICMTNHVSHRCPTCFPFLVFHEFNYHIHHLPHLQQRSLKKKLCACFTHPSHPSSSST